MASRRIDSWNAGLRTALMPILPLLADERITEIEANAFDEVWVKGSGWRGHKKTTSRWMNHEDFRLACIRVGEVIGRPVSETSPLCNARLPGGERVNVAVPPACAKIALTIRLFPAETMNFDALEKFGSVDKNLRQMLESLVAARKSLLIAGGTGSGKTSLLNALSQVIAQNERIVTIEDSRELQIQQPNWVAMETVEPFTQDGPRVTIGDLVKNALRQTPDRIVVGEVRGEEALFLLRALSTGHGGGLGTIHANDGVDALYQLQLLAQMADVGGLTSAVVAAMVARAVDLVVYQGYFEEGNARRVSEILEMDRPGVKMGTGNAVEYRVRRLVQWDPDRKAWTYPDAPSAALRATLKRRQLPWPEVSLRATGAETGAPAEERRAS